MMVAAARAPNRCAPVENGWASSADVGSPALSCGSGGTKSTGGVRAAGESAGGDGSASPARPVSGSSSDSSGPVHPSSRRRASSRSVTANFSSSCQTTRMSAALKYQPSRTRTRLARAYLRLVHFPRRETPVTVPMFDYGRKSHTYLLGIHNASGSDIWFYLEGGKLGSGAKSVLLQSRPPKPISRHWIQTRKQIGSPSSTAMRPTYPSAPERPAGPSPI